MTFPNWLPQAIADFVRLQINGEPSGNFGLERSRQDYLDRGDTSGAQFFADDIECLQRLAGLNGDDRIKEAYELLKTELSHPFAWQDFARAAWASRIEYSKYRGRHRQAKEKATRIAAKATELADLLEQASELYDKWPDRLYNLRALLQATDGRDPLWQNGREHLWATKPHDDGRRYIWSTAPTVADCLRSIAGAAHDFEPSEDGAIGAAIGSRQSNPFTEYIRAFGTGLLENQIQLTSTVQKAMAITVNVVLNDPERDVSYKDVKQALEQAGITRSQNP